MHGIAAGIVALLLVAPPAPFPFAEAEAELSVEIRADELRAHVYRLASPEFLGRSGPGAARASRHIAAHLEKLHLKPAFGDSFLQPIPWLLADPERAKDSFVGRNVGAYLPGSDPLLKDEWVLLSAHYDHLGVDGDKLYPGADDNASGVAMLLEVAEQFALRKEKPRRSVLFVAFDLEEAGLLGSTHFASHPPRNIKKLAAALTTDMLGRSMANVMDEFVFVLGSETSPRLRHLLETVEPPKGLKIGRLGADLIGTRSDYGPFRDRRAPFLFFSTGQHPDYHQLTDLPERLDYEKLCKISRWISTLTTRLANDDTRPVWEENHEPDLEEARTTLALVTRVLDHPTNKKLANSQREKLTETRNRLQAIVAREKMTPAERTWLLWTTRLLLVTVF